MESKIDSRKMANTSKQVAKHVGLALLIIVMVTGALYVIGGIAYEVMFQPSATGK